MRITETQLRGLIRRLLHEGVEGGGDFSYLVMSLYLDPRGIITRPLGNERPLMEDANTRRGELKLKLGELRSFLDGRRRQQLSPEQLDRLERVYSILLAASEVNECATYGDLIDAIIKMRSVCGEENIDSVNKIFTSVEDYFLPVGDVRSVDIVHRSLSSILWEIKLLEKTRLGGSQKAEMHLNLMSRYAKFLLTAVDHPPDVIGRYVGFMKEVTRFLRADVSNLDPEYGERLGELSSSGPEGLLQAFSLVDEMSSY